MTANPLTRRASARLCAVVALVAGLVAVALVASGTTATAATKTAACKKYDTLRTGQSAALAYAPAQIAAANGFMKKNCIKLEEQEIAGATVLLAQVQAGRADLGFLNPAGIIQAVQSGLKLKIVAPNTGTGDFAFCVGPKSSITSDPKTWKQFEGKSIAQTVLAANTDIAVRVLLYRAGVDLNKVKFVQVPQATISQSIINGTVEGGQCNEPNLTQFKSQFKIIDQNPMSKVFGADSPVTYAYVTEDYLKGHKDLVTRYQKAYLAAAKLTAKSQKVFRNGAHFFAKLPTSITNTMRLPSLPTSYGIDDLMKQVKQLVRFGGLKQSISEAQVRALFVPLPSS